MNEKMEASSLLIDSPGSWKFMIECDTDTDTLYMTRLKTVRNSNLGSVIHSVTDKRSLRVGDTVSDTEWQ